MTSSVGGGGVGGGGVRNAHSSPAPPCGWGPIRFQEKQDDQEEGKKKKKKGEMVNSLSNADKGEGSAYRRDFPLGGGEKKGRGPRRNFISVPGVKVLTLAVQSISSRRGGKKKKKKRA